MGITQGNYAYIDGTNLHKGIEALGWKLDYKKFRVFLKERYGVEKAYLFLGFVTQNVSMYRDLQDAGYTLVLKPTILTAKREVKGNCDGEMILQATCDFYEKKFDNAIIVTGDGDFACLANFLNLRKTVRAILAPNRAKCSMLLKRSNARLTFLEEVRHLLEYRK